MQKRKWTLSSHWLHRPLAIELNSGALHRPLTIELSSGALEQVVGLWPLNSIRVRNTNARGGICGQQTELKLCVCVCVFMCVSFYMSN